MSSLAGGNWWPATAERRERGGWEALAWWGLGLGAGVVLLAVAARYPLHPVLMVMAALGLGGAAWLVLGHPAWGACALILVIYWNASYVVTETWGFAWLLRLLIAGVLLAWVARRMGGPAPMLAARWPLLTPMLLYGAAQAAAAVGASDSQAAVAALWEFGKALIAFYLVVQLLNRPRYWRWGLNAVLAAAALLALPVVYQGLTGSRNLFWGFGAMEYVQIVPGEMAWRLGGAIGDPNFLAMVLVAALPLALVAALEEKAAWWRRGWGAAVAGLVLAAIVFTYSRDAVLGVGVVATALMWQHRRRPLSWLLLAAALAGAVALAPQGFLARIATLRQASLTRQQQAIGDSSFRIRRNAYLAGALMFLHHPLLGVGPGNYEAHYLKYSALIGLSSEDTVRDPHSLPVQIAAETGLAGLASFLLLLAAAFRLMERARRRLRADGARHYAAWIWAVEVALAAYLAESLFLHDAYIRHFWLLLSLGALGASLAGARRPSVAATIETIPETA